MFCTSCQKTLVGLTVSFLFHKRKLKKMKLECQDTEEENVFQEYFEHLMKTEGIQYPTAYDEVLTLF